MKTSKHRGLLNFLSRKVVAILGTVLTVVVGACLHGNWMILLVHTSKLFGWKLSGLTGKSDPIEGATTSKLPENTTGGATIDTSQLTMFAGVHLFVLLSVAVSFLSYYGLGGWLQYYYYIKRRGQAHEWKCQPDKFLTADNEKHEILLGSFNMMLGGALSGVIACYIMNGGYTTLYFSVVEKGFVYLTLSTVGLFILTDALAYYAHRLIHIPSLYKCIHKWHHRYHQPTAFSAVAMHPLEFLIFQSIVASPVFYYPIYSGSFIAIILYQYYFGMIDHSGIKMESIWPWQPPTLFHDNHHKYFHVNFGFNLGLWDWLHDTARRSDRIYGETIFYGKGMSKNKEN